MMIDAENIVYVPTLAGEGTGPPDWPEKWKKALFVGLNRLNGQFTARLAIIMALSHHESQRCFEVEPPLGSAAMACKPILIQVTFLRAHSSGVTRYTPQSMTTNSQEGVDCNDWYQRLKVLTADPTGICHYDTLPIDWN